MVFTIWFTNIYNSLPILVSKHGYKLLLSIFLTSYYSIFADFHGEVQHNFALFQMLALFQIKGKQIGHLMNSTNTYITIVAVTGKTYLYLLLVLSHSMGMHERM